MGMGFESFSFGKKRKQEKPKEEKPVEDPQLRIKELEQQKRGITAFGDITSQDRVILAGIDRELEGLKNEELGSSFEDGVSKLFSAINEMGEIQSTTDDHVYSKEEMTHIIYGVLSGSNDISQIPSVAIKGDGRNLREEVQELLDKKK
ncbi:hypothetical protein HOB25_01915 [bacterium]|jgi:hypothetical protein|nr:hypothetical protein [bacterium]MBT4251662.1 hypothetical protein [bacterium]MBT4597712.1 hypothetical protein [bacterium]MBT6753724.1 hypothetical protein [bacterium]MBT7037861.1 hypothetical protein [bacterium]